MTIGLNRKTAYDVTPSKWYKIFPETPRLIYLYLRAIEDNVRTSCGTLITECVVVGSGRPSPVMFIEPAGDLDHEKLKKEIIRKTRHFHSRRYIHERITSTKMIVIVPPKTLPRTATKGNIRRKAVEETFKTQLDQIYGTSP